MRWAGHVACMGEGCTGFWWGNLRERDHWGEQDVDGRIILRWIFRKWEGVVGTGWSWLHTVHTACHPTLQHHNSYNRTDNHRQWNAVGSPDDGHKDARNMLR